MKKSLVLGAAALVFGALFFSCANGTQDPTKNQNQNVNDPDDNKNDDSKNDPSSSSIVKNSKVSFNFANANAVAKLESTSNASKAAVDADSLGDLVKILADGTMENAITVEEGASLADIVAIYKSPVEGSEDFFVVFNGTSVISREEVAIERKDEWSTWTEYQTKETKIGQLICVHADGTVRDILKKDVEENTNEKDYYYDYDAKNYLSLRTDTVTFDASGNVYFIVNDSYWDYDKNGYGSLVDNGQCIYQFNPKTNELTQMVAAVAGTSYERMQIDNDGEWIFASGRRNEASFLRAIPILNPNNPVNIFYSSNTYNFDANKWAYDDAEGVMYYLAKDGTDAGLYIATKAGGFKDKKFVKRNTFETEVEKEETSDVKNENTDTERLSDRFEVFYSSYSKFYWGDEILDNKVFSADKLVDFLLNRTGTFYSYDISSDKYLTLDMVDIKFDAFANQTGPLKVLYLLTKGKKNQDALNALNNYYGMASLYLRGNDGYENWKDKGRGYNDNFLADIIYVKDSDTLLRDSDAVVFTYADSSSSGSYVLNSETGDYEWVTKYSYKEQKGSDFFPRYDDGTYENNAYLYGMLDSGASGNCYIAYNLKVDASDMLKWFFSYCNAEGDYEFNLSSFKDDETYGDLYTSLKDEAALNWISEDISRLSLFYKLLEANTVEEEKYNGAWYWTSDPSSFVSKTCFVKGTNTCALIKVEPSDNTTQVVSGQYSIPYCYSGSEWVYFTEGTENYSGPGSGSLSATKDGVFYEFTNLYDSWWTSEDTKPFYFIVKLSYDNDSVEEVVTKIALPIGKVVTSQKVGGRIFMQYSLTNAKGSELGYHHIYSVDISTGEVMNHFENVANRNGLEVNSYSVAGRNLYFSAVRGTAVENQIVDIITNECNPLAVQRKMVAVYAF